MRTAISSAGIARPALGGRDSGIVPVITGKRSSLLPLSMPPRPTSRWLNGEIEMPRSMLLFALVAMAVGGLAWVFIYPLLSGERKAEKRQQSVVRTDAPASSRVPRNAGKPRREQIEATLKEIDKRRAKSASLSTKITQAGLSWSKQRFFITSGILAVAAFLAGLLANAGLLTALGFGFAAGAGFPHWLLKFLKKRREAKFLLAFPDAVDIIVRGVKA